MLNLFEYSTLYSCKLYSYIIHLLVCARKLPEMSVTTNTDQSIISYRKHKRAADREMSLGISCFQHKAAPVSTQLSVNYLKPKKSFKGNTLDGKT